MDTKKIIKKVNKLVKTYGTRNPFILAKELGIIVLEREYSPKTKGFYIKTLRNKFIFINSLLDDYSKQIVAAHELGHAVLHSEKFYFKEYTLFPKGRYECEANKFVAELIITDEIMYNYEFLLKTLRLPEELIKYKLSY